MDGEAPVSVVDLFSYYSLLLDQIVSTLNFINIYRFILYCEVNIVFESILFYIKNFKVLWILYIVKLRGYSAQNDL